MISVFDATRLSLLSAKNPNFYCNFSRYLTLNFAAEKRQAKILQQGNYDPAALDIDKLKGAAGKLGAYTLQKACV